VLTLVVLAADGGHMPTVEWRGAARGRIRAPIVAIALGVVLGVALTACTPEGTVASEDVRATIRTATTPTTPVTQDVAEDPATSPAVSNAVPIAPVVPPSAPLPLAAPPPAPPPPPAVSTGCADALAYLTAHQAEGFVATCGPGTAFGRYGVTCWNVAGMCPNGARVIRIACPAPFVYMNEAHNSWSLTGRRTGIDPFGQGTPAERAFCDRLR
jgi:hypothetical protein